MVCFRCGRAGHYAPGCYARTRADGSEISGAGGGSGEGEERLTGASSPLFCFLESGRNSHTADRCYSTSLIDGSQLNVLGLSSSASGGFGGRGVNTGPPAPAVPTRPCATCGRASHASAECYAGTRVDGSLIVASTDSGGSVCHFCDASGHSVDACPRRAPGGNLDPPPRNRMVCNIQGSSLNKPWFGSSWKGMLEEIMGGVVVVCMARDCDGRAELGAHVWLKGDRKRYYIAGFCEQCNHRHGDEEICYCRYVGREEEPKMWIPIKDTWMMKVAGSTPTTSPFDDFKEWCDDRNPVGGVDGHGFREKCCSFCVGGGGSR